jgi:hypothetical protein
VSNIAAEPAVQVCEGRPDAGPVRQLLPARAVPLGESTVVRRLLPTMGRMVGPCFVDHYGRTIARPVVPRIRRRAADGELAVTAVHRDSLGSDVPIHRVSSG